MTFRVRARAAAEYFVIVTFHERLRFWAIQSTDRLSLGGDGLERRGHYYFHGAAVAKQKKVAKFAMIDSPDEISKK